MPYLLDTGILLRMIRPHDPDHAATRAAIRKIGDEGERRCYLPQNLAEFWNVCTRPASARGGFGLTVEQTDRAAKIIERLFVMLPESPAIYSEWRRLVVATRAQGVQVHDARVAAAMYVHGVGRILTLNTRDFQRYPNIVAVHPNDL